MTQGTIGFVGAGNMAGAMVRGLHRHDPGSKGMVSVYDVDDAKARDLAESAGASHIESLADLAASNEYLVLAVKPKVYEHVLREIGPVLTPGQVVVSITPSFALAWLAERLPEGVFAIRLMPNTPALVGAGMISFTPGSGLPADKAEYFSERLRTFAEVVQVDESLIPAVIGVSGSAPAYVFQFIEAMADGAVAEGMTRDAAYRFAARTVFGAAKMVLETGEHPGALKDMVTSPGGTTIEAVATLEAGGMRAAVIGAVRAAARKTRDMGS